MKPDTLRVLTLFCFFRFISTTKLDDGDVISLLADVLLYQKLPTLVTAFLCMDRDFLVKFNTILSTKGYLSEARIECSELSYSDHNSLFILDINCPYAQECLKKAEAAVYFGGPNRWIIFDSNLYPISDGFPNINASNMSSVQKNSSSAENKYCIHSRMPGIKHSFVQSASLTGRIFSQIKEYSFLCDSNVLVAVREDDTSFSITQVYKRTRVSQLETDIAGAWSRASGLKLPSSVASIRRMDLQGALLTAAIVITDNDTLNHLTDYKDKHIDTISKTNFALTHHLIDSLNASKRFVYESSWGYPAGRGWSGMIGRLQRGEAELGGTPLFVTADRVAVIDYIAMTTPTLARFVFRQPQLSYVTNIFLLPFSWTVWITVAVLIVMSVVTLRASSKWENKHPSKSSSLCSTCGAGDNRLRDRWGEVWVLALGAVTQQGSHTEPRSLHGRVIAIILFVVMLFLYTAYSANIVALIQSPSDSIKTLTDLLHSRIKLGVHDQVYNRYYFPKMTDPVHKAIWEKKIAPKGSSPRFMQLKEGVERMRQGLFAFHMELGSGYKVVGDLFHEHEKCGLQEIPFLQVHHPWYSIQKNSSYKEIFKIGMRRIHESGIQKREVQRLYTKKPECTAKGSSFVSVGLEEVRPALLWLAWAAMAATAVLAAEIISHRRGIPKKMISK